MCYLCVWLSVFDTPWNIVQAVEGNTPLFKAEIRQNLPDAYTKCPCLIKVVRLEAEEQMRLYLDNKTLGWYWYSFFIPVWNIN